MNSVMVLVLMSYGLVNETFEIRADLATKQLSWVVVTASDKGRKESSRPLTPVEVKELTRLRDRALPAWVDPPKNPGAEYGETLAVGPQKSLNAQGGFAAVKGPAGELARRLRALAGL